MIVTVLFWVAALMLAAAVGAGLFLAVAEPVAVATAAVLRWRDERRDMRRSAA